ncbi:hypothetical protein GLOIN_2v75200 [Rhizophagus irregularis DAOM 181602=DAOM 197198]|nr:hypothetical protein GLOIN_2v75200 [Rhizophagus irregularis DAOM 181602=DAOM 197198]
MSYNSAIDKIDKIDVDKNDVDKIFTFDNINDKRHNGKHITMIEISPKEKYLITYSKVDRSMVGWDVENIDKVQLKFHQTVNIDEYGINDIQLYNFMNHTGLFFLPSLFYYTPNKEIKYCWNNKYKNSSNQTSFYHYNQTFVILNGRVWKSKFGEYMSKMNFSSENSDELNKENNKVIECGDHAKVNKKTYKHLNVHSFNLYMDTVFTLFQKATTNDDNRVLVELTGNLIKWNVHVDNDKIKLEVFRKINTKLESISTRIENHPYKLVDYNHQII